MLAKPPTKSVAFEIPPVTSDKPAEIPLTTLPTFENVPNSELPALFTLSTTLESPPLLTPCDPTLASSVLSLVACVCALINWLSNACTCFCVAPDIFAFASAFVKLSTFCLARFKAL